MNAAALAVTAAGAGLLGLVALDIYRTILHSRGRSGPVTETLIRTVWRLAARCRFSPLAPGPPPPAQPRGPAAFARDCRDAGGVDPPWVRAALLAAPCLQASPSTRKPKARAASRPFTLVASLSPPWVTATLPRALPRCVFWP
jgi:hypothetical protein